MELSTERRQQLAKILTDTLREKPNSAQELADFLRAWITALEADYDIEGDGWRMSDREDFHSDG